MLKSLAKNLFFYKYFNFVLFFSLFLYSITFFVCMMQVVELVVLQKLTKHSKE